MNDKKFSLFVLLVLTLISIFFISCTPASGSSDDDIYSTRVTYQLPSDPDRMMAPRTASRAMASSVPTSAARSASSVPISMVNQGVIARGGILVYIRPEATNDADNYAPLTIVDGVASFTTTPDISYELCMEFHVQMTDGRFVHGPIFMQIFTATGTDEIFYYTDGTQVYAIINGETLSSPLTPVVAGNYEDMMVIETNNFSGYGGESKVAEFVFSTTE